MSFVLKKHLVLHLAVILGFFLGLVKADADPSKYPQFAQHEVPEGVEPKFINLEQLVEEIINKKKPLMIDVRSREEYEAGHIKAAISIPLNKITLRLDEIPKDKLVVFY